MVINVKVLITGATSGIGYATALKLLERNHFVYFTVHKEKEVKTLREKLTFQNIINNYEVLKLDITNKKDQQLVKELDIDCLFCNASIGYGGSILDIPISNIEDNFKVNVFSNIEIIQKYYSNLYQNNKKGKIVVMSSIAGIIPIPFLGSYSATKSSLISMITCLRNELKIIKSNIKIKLIEPGIYNTGFNDVMIENKKQSIYFKNIEDKITKIEKNLFRLFGKNKTDSIVRKIVKAIESNSNKLVYSAPITQKISAKLYSIFK